MKKIEFGYSNDTDPKGSWEGIGIKPGLLLTDADYYGAIGFGDSSYIVAKVMEDKYNKYPDLLNKFIVREAIYDMYADGSGVLMLNQEESLVTQKLEELLNNTQIKDRVNGIDDIIHNCDGMHNPTKNFILAGMDENIMATSITKEAFETRKNALNNCHSSISDMQIALSNSYVK